MNIEKLFNKYNKKHFDSVLVIPQFREINDPDLRGYFMGVAWEDKPDNTIAINYKHRDHKNKKRLKETLLHEMVHQYQFHFGMKINHGKYFKKWVKYFSNLGYKIV